jgi:hypothetical protein
MEYTYELRYVMGDTLVLTRIYQDRVTGITIDENNPEYQQYLVDTDGGLPIPEQETA